MSSVLNCNHLSRTFSEGEEALQDRYPGNHCFGCGPLNRRGLRLKSQRVGDVCVARFRPSQAQGSIRTERASRMR